MTLRETRNYDVVPTIYVAPHYPMYRVWKTVGGYVVVYIEDQHNFRHIDGGKVHKNRQNAYAKAQRLNKKLEVK